MGRPEQVARVITEFWPDYVDMVGDDVTLRIVEEVTSGRDPAALHEAESGGEKFDFVGLIELIGSAVGIVAFGLECYDRFESRTGRRQRAEELEAELRERARLQGAVSEISEQLRAVAEFIVRNDSSRRD